MLGFSEHLNNFINDFDKHIHSLYLIGSRADGTNRPNSDYDIVCLTTPNVPYSVSKMMIYEFHKIGLQLKVQVEPFIIPLDYFLKPQHFASYDFLVRISLADHGKCLHGESVLPEMPMMTEDDLFNFRLWMCLVMYNDLALNEKPTLHLMISFLASLSTLTRLIPASEWVSKRKLLQSIPVYWHEGHHLMDTQGHSLNTLRSKILDQANILIEGNLNRWLSLTTLSFTKPLFEFENITLDDKFLFSPDERMRWRELEKHGLLAIDHPFPRIVKWWNLTNKRLNSST